MAYVYKHIRLDTNEVFYIGIGSDKYFYRANDTKRRNKYWSNITNMTDWSVEIIVSDITYDEAKSIEIEYIELYKRKQDGGTLCNLTKGGEGTLGLTPVNVKTIYAKLKTGGEILVFNSHSDFKKATNSKTISTNKNGQLVSKQYYLSENKNDLLKPFIPINSLKGKSSLPDITWFNVKTNESVTLSLIKMAEYTNLSTGTFKHLKQGRQKQTKCGWTFIN